jgi:hypothetical protein
MKHRQLMVKASLDKALECVSLPQYQPHETLPQPIEAKTKSSFDQSNEPPSEAKEETELEKRNPYMAVFTWLKTKPNAVDKIFRVSVEDRYGKTPHTDDGIRDILKPFDVEIWDWRKNDISSDTILEGAENARELYLYWSGNKAVMRSWACKHGLATLKMVRLY